MITFEQRDLIRDALRRYNARHSSITMSELESWVYDVKITSPKSGKPITLSTYSNYRYGVVYPTKGIIMDILEHILATEKVKPQRGFFI